ncbi:hypothetical protein WJX81_006708 [Elliptochloris bilobata]|uniref:Uncharacterized protein n=1 Tax=Elliptochloris bilobata TaxID=381761 RepID=A0AAW1QLY2_9CHLO
MMADMHASMNESVTEWATYPSALSIDQLMNEHAKRHNGTWTVGVNLNSANSGVGIFFQDKEQFRSTILRR